MLPVLILAGVALLATGCAASQKPEPQKPEPKEPPAPPKLDPPEEPQAKDLFLKLKKDYGLQDAEINRGCHRLDLANPGPGDRIVEAGGDLKACEVYDFVLDHYEKYPELAASLTGKPIPWTLDDLNPATAFDEGLRTRVKAAIAKLEQILLKQGHQPGTEAFQEKMAVGLFYFTYFPENPDHIQKNRESLLMTVRELRDTGLQDFETYLFQKGGFGVAEFQGDAPREATALEALSLKKGWCTERSKILFAVFRMAQLPAFFLYGRGWEMAKQLKQAGIELTPQQRAVGHHFVGLSLGQRVRSFDLSLFNSQAQYPKFYGQSLSHFLSADLNNRANGLIDEGKLAEAEKPLLQAERLAPDYFGTYANLTDIYYKRSEFEKALAAAKRAVELEPNFAEGHYNLFAVQEQLGQDAAALESLRKAAALAPEVAEFQYTLGILLAEAGKTQEALPHLKSGLALDPKHPSAVQARDILKK